MLSCRRSQQHPHGDLAGGLNGWRSTWTRSSTVFSKRVSGTLQSLWNCKTLPLKPQRLLKTLKPRRVAETEGFRTERRLSNHLLKPCLPTRTSFTPLQDTTAQIRLACLHPWHSLGRVHVTLQDTPLDNGLEHSPLEAEL
jgi:hypothetical protein